jgi:pimeloyl-ACP methyl ester carboxylesterase
VSELIRDGVAIYYHHHRAQVADAPTILLSHGYAATSNMWSGQLGPLGATHDLITWDMRGHGRSASPSEISLFSERHTVDDMAAILDACAVERAVIGGLSLGGYMTLAFHLAYPQRCSALMLFDTGPGYKSDTARDDWNSTANDRAAALDAEGFAALGNSNEVRIAEHGSAAGLAQAARGMLAQVDDRVICSLPQIDPPTLVLVGDNDRRYHIPTDYMAGKIPGAAKVVLKGAGHAANLDQPDAFNEAVQEFLARI